MHRRQGSLEQVELEDEDEEMSQGEQYEKLKNEVEQCSYKLINTKKTIQIQVNLVKVEGRKMSLILVSDMSKIREYEKQK